MLKLTFYGAAREVTGSCHLLEADGMNVLLDCGLFQGRRSESNAKNQEFPIDPAKLHAVVLSHAHIDHCGRLPLLVKRGFCGPIFATAATRDLCALLLADSAHIQAEDARFLNKKRARRGEPPIEPIYDDNDAADALRQFQTISNDRTFWVTRRLKARFREAGHMLGSASVELTFTPPNGPKPVSLVFTGDLGRFDIPILRDPRPLPDCDYLITESTYGGRRHPPADDLPAELEAVIKDTVQRGGKVIVPAFSVGRTQVIVYSIHRLMTEGRIPEIPVFIDSPLSVNATEVFRLHPELFDADARSFQRANGDILGAECCTYIRDVDESKRLNRRRAPCVIISASGMCETGRIVHHLRNNIQSPKNTVLIVGFQAAHTLGRRLVEGEEHVNIFGKKLRVRAKVVTLNGFSAHADRDELRRLHRPLAARCRTAFLVHGEMEQMEALSRTMRDDGFRDVRLPASSESVRLDPPDRRV